MVEEQISQGTLPHKDLFRCPGRLFIWTSNKKQTEDSVAAESASPNTSRNGVWRSLGSGTVCITENATNGHRKLYIRRKKANREILAYHSIEPGATLASNPDAEREWVFMAPRYKNNQLSMERYMFGLRLRTVEDAMEFKRVYDEAREHMRELSGVEALPQGGSVTSPHVSGRLPQVLEGDEDDSSRQDSPQRSSDSLHHNNHKDVEFQKFLDSNQYTRDGILKYERVFGYGYVSTGGYETTKQFLPLLHLEPGQKVLDIGCGIGGGDFEMAKKYGVSVLGIDLSANMLAIAAERAEEAQSNGEKLDVDFKELDATTADFPDAYFDVIYSRDTILHIADKHSLFRSFFRWLKPGGRLLISDYCCGNSTDKEFDAYVKQRGYHLLDVPEYGRQINQAGFQKVDARNVTNVFTSCLRRELEETSRHRDLYAKEFGVDAFESITDGWKRKLQRCDKGHQKWGLFIGYKPPVPSKTHWDFPNEELPGHSENEDPCEEISTPKEIVDSTSSIIFGTVAAVGIMGGMFVLYHARDNNGNWIGLRRGLCNAKSVFMNAFKSNSSGHVVTRPTGDLVRPPQQARR